MITRFRIEAEAKTDQTIEGDLDEAARALIELLVFKQGQSYKDWQMTDDVRSYDHERKIRVGRRVFRYRQDGK